MQNNDNLESFIRGFNSALDDFGPRAVYYPEEIYCTCTTKWPWDVGYIVAYNYMMLFERD